MLAETYLGFLRAYLRTGDEEIMRQFSTFGRQSVANQIAQEDIIELHTRAMLDLTETGEFSQEMLVRKGGECLGEVIINYSLAFREQQSRREIDSRLKLFSQVIENTQDGIIITDPKGLIVQVNPAFSRVTGYSKKEIVGENPRLLQSGLQDKAFYQAMWQELQEKGEWQGKIWNRRKNGEVYPEQLSITSVYNQTGEHAYYVGIFSDISEQVNLEEQLQQAQKMEAVGTLVGGIAHDFNNILAGVIGNLYMLRKQLTQADSLSRVDNIEQLSRRGSDMIAQLLAFARKGVVQMQDMDLGRFIGQAIKLAKVGVPENVSFSEQIEKQEMVIRGDPTQLQQVLMNLLSNACDAVAEGDTPRISLSMDRFVPDKRFIDKHELKVSAIYARLSISDNGCGIRREDMEHIFEPFYTTKEVGKGTGLGLSMVYGMMQSHNGVVELDSSPGNGTRFSLYFPLIEQKPAEVRRISSCGCRGSETILLADDEDHLRQTVAEVLQSFGYSVIQARDGREAIVRFEANRDQIALAILDVVMPFGGGPELASEIRLRSPDMPIIFSTGYDRSHVLDSGGSIDHSRVMTKPFDFEEMSRVIRSLLEQA